MKIIEIAGYRQAGKAKGITITKDSTSGGYTAEVDYTGTATGSN
jgi:hypothetical protein